MVTPHQRSRTLRRVAVTTPGGDNVIHFRKRNAARAQCSACGKVLAGVPHVRATQMKGIPKTQRRPERPYGGVLCSPCMRIFFINSVQEKKQ